MKNINWKTAAGTIIPVADMTSNHLANVIAMLRREKGDCTILQALILGLKELESSKVKEHWSGLNGEMAQAIVDQGFDELAEGELEIQNDLFSPEDCPFDSFADYYNHKF